MTTVLPNMQYNDLKVLSIGQTTKISTKQHVFTFLTADFLTMIFKVLWSHNMQQYVAVLSAMFLPLLHAIQF